MTLAYVRRTRWAARVQAVEIMTLLAGQKTERKAASMTDLSMMGIKVPDGML